MSKTLDEQVEQSRIRTVTAGLRAENVRLQERVEELERHLEMDDPRLLKSVELTARVRKERDRYKALAERFARSLHYKDVHELTFKDCPYRICQEARAAIDLTPEEEGR